MWRLGLIGIGVYAGYRLAKLGQSRYNFLYATLAAALAYKLTRDRMVTTGDVNTSEANTIREVEIEGVE